MTTTNNGVLDDLDRVTETTPSNSTTGSETMYSPQRQEPISIAWANPDNYDLVLEESRQTGKPILLDLHLPSCGGCQGLERTVYSSPEVARAIQRSTIPLRVVMEEPT